MSDQTNKSTTLQFNAHQKLTVALLALTQFTVILDLMVIAPLGDILMKSLNIDTHQFGLVVSVYSFSAGISGLLTAGFADKFDRKKLLIFFYLGFIVGTFLCAIAPNFHFLLFARIFTGLFGGVIGSISMTIVTDLFPLEMRGRAIGILQMGFAGSTVLGIPVGLYCADIWGWHSSFWLIVILSLIIVLLIMKFLEPVNKHLEIKKTNNIWKHYKDILVQKNYLLAFLTTSLVSMGGFMLQPFGSAFLVNNLKVLQTQLPIIFVFTGIATLIIMPLVGKISDKIDKFKIFAFGSVWSIIMIYIYTHLEPMPLWMIIGVNIILFIGIMSRMVPAISFMSAIPAMQDRGAFMSINSSLQQIAGGFGAYTAGLIVVQHAKSDPIQHYPTLGFIVIALSTICIFLIYKISLIVKNKQVTKVA